LSQFNKPSLIIETAKVIAVDQGMATVECVSKSACGSCGSAEHCGNSSLAKAFPKRTHQLQVELTERVEPGEQIELALNAKNMLHSALVIYLMPLLLLIAGAGIGKAMFDSNLQELASILLGGVGLACGFILVKLYSKRHGQSQRFRPRMIGRKSLS